MTNAIRLAHKVYDSKKYNWRREPSTLAHVSDVSSFLIFRSFDCGWLARARYRYRNVHCDSSLQ